MRKKKGKTMRREIYNMLTRGDDGMFTISGFETLDNAREALRTHIECQEAIEGKGADMHVDYHTLERLSVPGFVIKPEDVISHVTVFVRHGDVINRTDRYVVKVQIS